MAWSFIVLICNQTEKLASILLTSVIKIIIHLEKDGMQLYLRVEFAVWFFFLNLQLYTKDGLLVTFRNVGSK